MHQTSGVINPKLFPVHKNHVFLHFMRLNFIDVCHCSYSGLISAFLTYHNNFIASTIHHSGLMIAFLTYSSGSTKTKNSQDVSRSI